MDALIDYADRMVLEGLRRIPPGRYEGEDRLEDDGFGFQLIGGVSWRQTERIRWDAELRWLYYGEADLDDGNGVRLEDVDYAPVTVQVGFSYGF